MLAPALATVTACCCLFLLLILTRSPIGLLASAHAPCAARLGLVLNLFVDVYGELQVSALDLALHIFAGE